MSCDSNIRYVIFSVARSGSLAFSSLFGEYLIRHRGYTANLFEYFNAEFHKSKYYENIYIDGRFSHHKIGDSYYEGTYKLDYCLRNGTIQPYKDKDFTLDNFSVNEIKQKRLELLLKKNQQKYLIKISPNSMTNELFDYFNSRYTFIIMDRLNWFEQFLSLSISNHTGIWHLYDDTSSTSYKIEIDKNEFESFWKTRMKFDQYRKKINNFHDILYEDIHREGWNSIFNKMGFVFDIDDYLNVRVPIKLNTSIEERCSKVKNIKQVISWFDEKGYSVNV